jgi:hypothetical protein
MAEQQTQLLLTEEVLHKEIAVMIILTEDPVVPLQQTEVITTIIAETTIHPEATLLVHHVHQTAVEEA